MSIRPFRAFVLLIAILALALGGPLQAQVPDCTGISGVHNTDPDLDGELTSILVASGLTSPVFITASPGDDERMFVLEQAGRIRIIKDGGLLTMPFLDISATKVNSAANERGLLGLAFHPDYQNNRYFFIYYTSLTTAQTANGDIVIERYERSAGNPDIADAGSGQIVINIPHGISNHNGGTVAFSPLDGHLYFAVGDGGSACDPGPGLGNAQNLNSLLGKMHRLNVDSLPYTTDGNPFDGGIPGLDEIWAFGLRNPYRFSFDRVYGTLYIGDVGQNALEEVNCTKASSVGGENYGWVPFEGNSCNPSACTGVTSTDCDNIAAEHMTPVRDYPLAGAPQAVIGGRVYRGCRMADLHGTYFYADHGNSGLMPSIFRTFRTTDQCQVSAEPDLDRETDVQPGGGVFLASVTAFGEDNQGELWVTDRGGEVYRILPEFNITELSGPNAPPLYAEADGSFSWEPLRDRTYHQARYYKVYRSDIPSGTFECVQKQLSSSTNWDDLDDPDSGNIFYYLVTGQLVDLTENTGGAGSDGNLRTLDPDETGCPL